MAAPPVLYSSTQRFRPVFHALREAGVDVEAQLARFGFTEAQLLDPDSRVPRERVVELTGQLIWMSRCPAIGVLAAAHFTLPDLGVLGYLARHAATPREGLEHIVHFQRLIADAADLRIVADGDLVRVTLGLRGERPKVPPAADYSIGTLVQALRQLSGGTAEPVAVRLPRPRQRDLAPYHRMFGADLGFDADPGELVYAARSLEVPCPHAEPELAAILVRHARMLVAQLPAPSSFVEQVRGVIESQIAGGDPSLPAVAATLGVSERTLRRRLAQEASTFRGVLDRARCDHATISLNEGRLSITEIAVRIGFADATAFTRSFRRWTGKTPSEVSRLRAVTARCET
ncbi:MAG: AraC family transcriptional regulator [Polyangiales bacterium]